MDDKAIICLCHLMSHEMKKGKNMHIYSPHEKSLVARPLLRHSGQTLVV